MRHGHYKPLTGHGAMMWSRATAPLRVLSAVTVFVIALE